MTWKSTRLRNCAYWLRTVVFSNGLCTQIVPVEKLLALSLLVTRVDLGGVAIVPLGPFGKRNDFDPFRSRPITGTVI